jgi:membrane protein
MVVGIAFLLLVSLLVSAAISALNEFVAGLAPGAGLLMQLVNFAISLGIIILLFAALLKVLPDVKISWNDVWVGAIVTGLLFTLGKWAIGFYLGTRAPASTYGAAGSFVVLLLWVYYSAQILFLGAEFTQVYANAYGSRIVADDSAVPVTEEMRAEQGIPHEETKQKAKVEKEVQSGARVPVAAAPGTAAAQRRAATRNVSPEDESALQYYTIAVLALFIGVWRWLRGR